MWTRCFGWCVLCARARSLARSLVFVFTAYARPRSPLLVLHNIRVHTTLRWSLTAAAAGRGPRAHPNRRSVVPGYGRCACARCCLLRTGASQFSGTISFYLTRRDRGPQERFERTSVLVSSTSRAFRVSAARTR